MELIYRIIAFFMSFTALLSSYLPGHDTSPKAAVNTSGSLSGFSGEGGTVTEISLDKETTANCIVINENGMNIKGYLIEAKIGGEYEVITGGDTVGAYRFCDFDEVTAKDFRFTVTDCNEAGFKVDSIEICSRDTNNEDFRVVSYLIADGLNANYVPDEGRFKASTDIIIFSVATFNESGKILLRNEENLPSIIEKCREANPELRIHLNILGPAPVGPTWEEEQQLKFEAHAMAMQKNRITFIRNIVTVLDKYGFDGVYFDYEFPITNESKTVFSSFLVALDKQLGNKELGAALASWCSLLTAGARRALDNVEVMAYDLFDDYGYHAAFPSAYNEVKIFLENGYRKEQLHLGLAFYARPTDAAAEWHNYNSYCTSLGEFENLASIVYNGKAEDAYFNGRQLVRDKTAYALSAGLGGVMIWHLACDAAYDSEYSLYSVIDDTLAKP